jgi:hypothetical protein
VCTGRGLKVTTVLGVDGLTHPAHRILRRQMGLDIGISHQ